MHVLLRCRVPDGRMLYVCECGRLMGFIHRTGNEDDLAALLEGHRLHVAISLELTDAWRCGTTTQITNQIDPLKP